MTNDEIGSLKEQRLSHKDTKGTKEEIMKKLFSVAFVPLWLGFSGFQTR
jgi:hypothetical protein